MVDHEMRPECNRLFSAMTTSSAQQTQVLLDIKDKLIEHIARSEEQRRRIDSLEAAVYGNGHEGLKTLMVRTATKMKLLLWTGGVIVVSVIGVIVSHLAK